MRSKRNTSWIAGVIVAACAFALMLLLPVGLLGGSQPKSTVHDTMLDANDSPVSQKAEEFGGQGGSIAGSRDQQAEELEGAEYIPNVVLVDFVDGVAADEISNNLRSLDYIATDAVSDSDLLYGYAELTLADGVDVADAITRLEQEEFVAASQPNFVYHVLGAEESGNGMSAAANTDSPLVAQNIDLSAQASSVSDPRRGEQWGLSAIKAYDAWDSAKGNHSVTVAVLDSGLDVNHDDFSDGNSKTNVVGPYSVLQANEGGNTSDVADTLGHGTHVAGIISAGTNNGVGVAGVSYNANIMPVQVIEYPVVVDGKTTNRVTSANAAAGVEYVVEHAKSYGVRVLNISFGTTSAYTPTSAKDRLFTSALESARKADILVVYAAGNGGSSGAYSCFPCDADPNGLGVISVKQSGATYVRTSTSNFNESGRMTKELSAPGDAILSTWKGNSYRYDSGTSMATPFVSGTAALVFAANSNLTAKQVKEILCATAQDLNKNANLSSNTTFDYETGYGLVNAKDAVNRAKAGQLTPVAIKPITGATVTLKTTSYTYDGKAKTPSVLRVTLSDGTVLGSGDYKILSYSKNVNAGTASVTVGGIGNYTATASATFRINPAPISVSLSQKSFTFDGKVKNPTVTVYGPKNGKSNQVLSAAYDYTVSKPSGRTNIGTYTYMVTGKGNYTGSKSVSFTISAARVTVYRLYHTTDGEHFYTTSAYERKKILGWAGWNDEGVAWVVPSMSNTPVYRLYDRNTGEHHYTTSSYEKKQVLATGHWNDEGIAWYSDDKKAKPVYRLQNSSNYPHAHHYTLSLYERSLCMNKWGWRNEGIGWYALS